MSELPSTGYASVDAEDSARKNAPRAWNDPDVLRIEAAIRANAPFWIHTQDGRRRQAHLRQITHDGTHVLIESYIAKGSDESLPMSILVDDLLRWQQEHPTA